MKPIKAIDVPPRKRVTYYPEPYASRMKGRIKHVLGDLFDIKKFGVNLTRLAPNGESSVLHRHTKQEEFIYVISGNPTLITEDGEVALMPGMCAGFTPAGSAHQLVNRSNEEVIYLEIGDRIDGDEAFYPRDDLKAVLGPDGKWIFQHKDGKPF